jgi:DNA-binding NarL/FixJ family response regulator
VTSDQTAVDGGDAPPIRVVIADDQRLVRAGFAVMLNTEPGIEVVGEAGDGAEAVALAAAHSPDVVLLDIQMPVMDGLAAARRILATEGPRVLMLSTFGTDDYVYEALRIGASGFLLKDAPVDQLVTAIRCVAAGDALIDPSITKRLISQFARIPRPADGIPAALTSLTSRELDVMRLMARGLSNAEIAADLVVEDSTVKTHVKRVLMKLGLRDRVQVVVLAYETGFVVPDH